ncbi:MAG: tryptophan 7-halogenase [Elusimicrobia bacterium]|nr:tryptophan 7-halogenase [Elusimicrobiota bacterium]
MSERWDAIVIGGGPAGSTAGSLLAKAGRRVLVLEKAPFPRHHIGESLLPGLSPLFKRLGVVGDLRRAKFFVKTGGSYLWGRSRAPWSITFADLEEAPGYMVGRDETWAWHVERARFDELLLNAARRRGAVVRQPASVLDVALSGGRVDGLSVRGPDGRTRTERAALYLDASGQAGLLASRLGWRRFDGQLRNMAVYTYYEGARLFTGPRRNHIFIENIEDGWVWFIPLSERRVSVGVVTSLSNAPQARAGLEAFFLARLARTKEASARTAKARRVEPFRLERDWSYRSRRFAGENFLLLGDAAAFIDPLLSYGVTLAMHSAELAADCADGALAAPAKREALFAHYDAAHGARFDELRDFTKFFYDGNRRRESYFWKARRIADHAKNRYAKAAFTFLVSGHPHWDSLYARGYFKRFFSPLGVPARLRRDRRFLAALAASGRPDLALIDDPLPEPRKRAA